MVGTSGLEVKAAAKQAERLFHTWEDISQPDSSSDSCALQVPTGASLALIAKTLQQLLPAHIARGVLSSGQMLHVVFCMSMFDVCYVCHTNALLGSDEY